MNTRQITEQRRDQAVSRTSGAYLIFLLSVGFTVAIVFGIIP